jgi:thiamine kinase-like enzyme
MPLDDLAISFEPDLMALLRGGVPFRDEVAEQLDRLRDLQVAARATAWKPVLCHTDAAGDNILVTPTGELVLLDWDEAVVGPVENDFALLARDERPGGHALATVLRAHGGRLDPDRLAFCMLRRYLGDAAVRLARPPLDLDDFLMWCVLPWRGM